MVLVVASWTHAAMMMRFLDVFFFLLCELMLYRGSARVNSELRHVKPLRVWRRCHSVQGNMLLMQEGQFFSSVIFWFSRDFLT